MVWARLCFYYFYSLILTQFSYDTPHIRFYLPIYDLSAVFWCKNYVVLTVPACMRKLSVSSFFLNTDIPPSILQMWSANHLLLYRWRFIISTHRYSLFYPTGIARGSLFYKRKAAELLQQFNGPPRFGKHSLI